MVARPDPSNPASFYASVQSLCDAVDAVAVQIAGLGTTLSGVQAGVGAEAQARAAADAAEAQARSQADASEAQARAQGVASEASARADAIRQEQQARGVAIAAAAQALSAQINSLGDSLRDALRAETRARTSADDGEQQARTEAIKAQAQALADAVADLESQIAGKAGSADLTKQIADAIASIRAVTDAISATVTAQRLDFTVYPGRPGDSPVRYTFVSAASALGGARAALPPISPAMLAGTENGIVVRVDGAGIVAGRAACPLELGRLYRARFVVQRRANPADPTGDAVVCGVVYLDQSLRVLGNLVPVRTYPALITANGRQESEALISRSVGLGAAFQAPASARFMVPVVALYGADALTDVEVLNIEDVTGAFVLAPPIANFEARLAALESADILARLQALESEAGTPSKITFGSKGDAAFATIPDSVQVVELLGRRYAGDGGGGRYVRTAAQVAATADSFVSNGAVFLRETVSADVVAGMLESGFETWAAGLPQEPPPEPGKRWLDHGTPTITPAVLP